MPKIGRVSIRQAGARRIRRCFRRRNPYAAFVTAMLQGQPRNGAPRLDFDAIVDLVEANGRVLDLGCGDGALPALLVERKGVTARGVELDEANVRACIGKGLSVRQGNIEEGLADFADGAFDYVILSQTLAYLDRPAPVVREMLRVGRHVIISFDNAGYWRTRLRLLSDRCVGNSLTSGYPRQRLITIGDFHAFCAQQGAEIERAVFLAGLRTVSRLRRLRSTMAVFLLRR